jgi:DNA-binding PadR family transcriptional regulator
VETSVRSLMPFEFFVLFLTKIGLNTPYAIMTQTGVSVGATSPTLKRLEQKQLLTSTPGPRNRSSYRTTDRGEALLLEGLVAGPRVYGRPTSRGLFESLPRLIFFGWVKGDLTEARDVLRKAEFDLSVKARRAESLAAECRRLLERPLEGDYEEASAARIAAGYRLIKASAETVEIKLQLESLPQLSKMIEELPMAPALHFRAVPDRHGSRTQVSE